MGGCVWIIINLFSYNEKIFPLANIKFISIIMSKNSTDGRLKCTFATMFACYLVVHIDHGIMPAAIAQIQSDLKIGEA